jgi:hypothetical protein
MKINKIPHCQESSNRKITKYHSVRTVPTSMKNNKIVIFSCFSIGTVLTVWYFVVFHGCWNWPDSVIFCCFSIGTKYHNVRTVPTSMKNNKVPHCQNSSNRKTTK